MDPHQHLSCTVNINSHLTHFIDSEDTNNYIYGLHRELTSETVNIKWIYHSTNRSVTMKIDCLLHIKIRSSPWSYIDGLHRDQRFFIITQVRTCPNKNNYSENPSQKHSGLYRSWQKAKVSAQRFIPRPTLFHLLWWDAKRIIATLLGWL